MLALIVGPTLLIYVGALGLLLLDLRERNRAEVVETTTRLAEHAVARFDGVFRELATIADSTAALLDIGPDLDERDVFDLLRANVAGRGVVYGAAMAFEPGEFGAGDELFCPYVFRDGGGLREVNLTRDVVDWYSDPRWTWWSIPKATGAPVWTEPYLDAEGAGGALMVTYSAPFSGDGSFRGVTTVDVLVDAIGERIGASILGDLDFVVLTPDGRYVYSTVRDEIMGRTVFEVAEAAGRPDVAEAAARMLGGGSGVEVLGASGGGGDGGWWDEPQWAFYAPIGSTGWTLVALLPESEALAGANARMRDAVITLAATLALIVCGVWVTSGLLTRPIARLTNAVRTIAAGDLDHRVEVRSRDEIGRLGSDVNTMAEDLKGYTERLARERASSREAMIVAMAKLAESRDDDTGKHLERICRYVEVLATEIAASDPALDEAWVRTLTATAALHDIGKVGVPDSVLKKPGRLDDEERRVMNSHTTIGGDTLIAVKQRWEEDAFLRTAAEIALAHHEKWDGSGYPFGLSGEDISLPARIVAVADVYDALRSRRVYKPAMEHEKARSIIVEGSGAHFDPRVVEAFLATEEAFRSISEELR